MLGYNYRFFGDDGEVAANFILYSTSDDTARELAEELLEKSHWSTVEVWHSGKLIGRSSKAAKAA